MISCARARSAFAVAVDERARRAGAHAGGRVAVLEAAYAELALRHERQRLIPLDSGISNGQAIMQ